MDHDTAAGDSVSPALPTHKTCTKCGETKLVDTFSKQQRGKHGVASQCKKCRAGYNRELRSSNPERGRSSSQAWYEENRARKLAKNKVWREANRSRHRKAIEGWFASNPGKARSYYANRRVRKKQACPSWVDHDAITSVYAEAVRLTQETGIPHEVDHIVPLQGKNVCGLHVPWNLRAVPQAENRSKGNKLPDNLEK